MLKKKNIDKAKSLRKNLTEAERILWSKLQGKRLGVKFRRQAPVGNYIADFVCYEKKLIIELDGGQHNENTYDIKRDKWLVSQGFRVLRFWNFEIFNNLEGVLEVVWENVSPSP